jgi:hypothetical protein
MEVTGKLYTTTLPEFGEFALPGNLLIHNPSMSVLKNMENSGLDTKELDDLVIIMQALQLKGQLIDMFSETGQSGGSANQTSVEKILKEVTAIPAEELVHIPEYTNTDLEKITKEVIDTAGSLPEVRIGVMPPAELYKSQPLYVEKERKDISVSNRLLAIMSVVDESDESVETKAARILSKYNQQDEELEQENRQFGGAAPVAASSTNGALVPIPQAEDFSASREKINQIIAKAKIALQSQPNNDPGNPEIAIKKLAANVEQQLIFIKAEAHWKYYTKDPKTTVRTPEEYLNYLRWNTTREFAEIEEAAAKAKALKQSHETALFVMKLATASAHVGVGVWANLELTRLNIEGKHKKMVNEERAAAAKPKGWLQSAYSVASGAFFAGEAPSKDGAHVASTALVHAFQEKRRMEIIVGAAKPSIQLCLEAACNDPYVIATSKALLNEVGEHMREEAGKALEIASKQYAKTCQEFQGSQINYEASKAYARGIFTIAVGGVLAVATGGGSLFATASALAFSAGKVVEAGAAYEAAHAKAQEIRRSAINQLVCEGQRLTDHQETLQRQIEDTKASLAAQGKVADDALKSLQKELLLAKAKSIKASREAAEAMKANLEENRKIEEERRKREASNLEEQRKANDLKAKVTGQVVNNAASVKVQAQTFASAMEAKAAFDKMMAQLELAATDPELGQHLNIEGRGKAAAAAQEKQMSVKGGAGSPNVVQNAPYFKILDKENEEINKYNQLFKQIDERNEKLAALVIKQDQLVPPDAELIVNALRNRPTKGGAASQPNSKLREAVRFFNAGSKLLESKGVKLNTGVSMNQRGGASAGKVVNVPPMYEIFLLSSNVLPPTVVKLAFAMINGIDNTAAGLEEFTKTFLSAPQSNPKGGSLYHTKKGKGYRASGKKHTRKGAH